MLTLFDLSAKNSPVLEYIQFVTAKTRNRQETAKTRWEIKYLIHPQILLSAPSYENREIISKSPEISSLKFPKGNSGSSRFELSKLSEFPQANTRLNIRPNTRPKFYEIWGQEADQNISQFPIYSYTTLSSSLSNRIYSNKIRKSEQGVY
jgi:hypothetical protein